MTDELADLVEPPRYSTNTDVQAPLHPGLGARLAMEWGAMERMSRAELHAKYWPDGGPAWLFGVPCERVDPFEGMTRADLITHIRELTRCHAGQWLDLNAAYEQLQLECSRLRKQISNHDYETKPRRLNGAA